MGGKQQRFCEISGFKRPAFLRCSDIKDDMAAELEYEDGFAQRWVSGECCLVSGPVPSHGDKKTGVRIWSARPAPLGSVAKEVQDGQAVPGRPDGGTRLPEREASTVRLGLAASGHWALDAFAVPPGQPPDETRGNQC